ncbi:M10 family metallopeptidase C-terminal domain-containing protein [Yersinia frederiksenii]|uniref:M10 family metallopeptidase C-terminal domain-containing protein n=1 Tax=Yersinia frederiksenii TaxID=29484 RepID=UPI0021BD18D4|nr:M10 family metallopeptidase C-terminal domain-containing protein [Yersinia frederiksenii]
MTQHMMENENYYKELTREPWKKNTNNSTTTLFYSFNTNYPLWESDIEIQQGAPIFSFNRQQIRQAKIAMQSCADVANIQFIQASHNHSANLIFLNYGQPDGKNAGYAYYPSPDNFSSVWTNFAVSNISSPTVINFGGYAFIHEIGHALGLGHSHGPNGHTQQVSVMSYLSEQDSGADYGGNYPSTPQMLDIAALQYLYGANISTRTGNTTYGFNSNSNRPYFTAYKARDVLIFCVWDAGGIDTFDFSSYRQNQNINLNEGSFSNIGGLIGNVSIATGVCIENAIGGSGNDNIWGNSANNRITGGLGADQLWGGGGSNTFVYYRASDSLASSADTIHDFNVNKDTVDLSTLGVGKNKTRLVNKFSHDRGTEIMQKYDSVRDITYLMIDFDNNKYENDMLIQLTGKHQLSLNNFIFAPQLTA